MVEPRTANSSLSVAGGRLKTKVGHDKVWTKAEDFITAIEDLPFCRNEAQTVLPSTGSTTICESYWPPFTGSGSIGRGALQVCPRSFETWSKTCSAHELQEVCPATS